MKKLNLALLSATILAGATLGPGWVTKSLGEPLDSSPDAPSERPKPPAKVGHPSLMSPHASPITLSGDRVFVVNTPADTVDVIDARSRKVVARIDVGIDPVGIATRPDGREVWVTNHVSDSVSVIDTVPTSPTYLQVIATVQDLDSKAKATRFDEPVGVVFAGNKKAYVALSSENKIAVINVATRKVVKTLAISAQDPRAMVVRGERLYVLPFESNNKTQLSGGAKGKIDGNLVTFDAYNHSITNNNVLSLGHVLDIVKHPVVPDRDLYVFDTKTDRLVEVVDTLGTLLYGLTVDSQGRVFVAQTDARNDANGRSGTKKHGLAELENRAFLNQITAVEFDGDSARKPRFINLETLPPNHPERDDALATPFAIEVSADDSTLVVSAAGSDRVFTVDAGSGKVLGRVEVDAAPRGIALQSAANGKPSQAWVLNALANTVSLLDLSDPAEPKVTTTVTLEDPTHPSFKRGRIAFNTARASSTATFGCASCHPDGHTDQLLWVLQTPIVSGGKQIMPRSTMPVRGLRDTAPFHWDGIPGDPYGGNNSAHIHRRVKPNSSIEDPESTTRFLIDAGLATTMLREGDPAVNEEGKAGLLTAAERDDMARFLLNVPYPPAPRRAYTNVLSDRAEEGFELFHILGNHEGKPKPNVCGDCHRMPFLVSTNTPGTGMDAPTWRGAYDRFLILPQGRLNIIGFDFYRRIAERGIPERAMWRFSWRSLPRFDPVWEMVLEGSTGFSGSFARQVTLSKDTAHGRLTGDLLDALETSSGEGGVVLQVEGVFLADGQSAPAKLQFDAGFKGGSYLEVEGARRSFNREKLVSLAAEGKFVGTFTARHGANADYDNPQPALWTLGPIHAQRGKQNFPTLHGDQRTMTISGRHIREGAHLIVNGRNVAGTIRIESGEKLRIELERLPPQGMHFLQVQNPNGLFSNDFIFHVRKDGRPGTENNPARLTTALDEAIAEGDFDEIKRLVEAGTRMNAQRKDTGTTPLGTAAFHGRTKIARYLIKNGARVSASNRDGNTPLHVAAFLCHQDFVKLLLEKDAPVDKRNERRESPIDVVSGAWSDGLAGFYKALSDGGGLGLDLEEIQRIRPKVAEALRAHAEAY